MFGVFGSMLHPLAQLLDLLRSQCQFRTGRRHPFFGVRARDPAYDFGFVCPSFIVCFENGRGIVGPVQSKVGLSRIFVGTMTGKTVFRQDRPNVALKVNRLEASPRLLRTSDHVQQNGIKAQRAKANQAAHEVNSKSLSRKQLHFTQSVPILHTPDRLWVKNEARIIRGESLFGHFFFVEVGLWQFASPSTDLVALDD
jgi:hypothetical protein